MMSLNTFLSFEYKRAGVIFIFTFNWIYWNLQTSCHKVVPWYWLWVYVATYVQKQPQISGEHREDTWMLLKGFLLLIVFCFNIQIIIEKHRG